jgi:hypothetical protein
MLLNTIAFVIFMVEIIIYTGTEHTLKGCLYDPGQEWCYTDLHCGQSSGPQHQNGLS